MDQETKEKIKSVLEEEKIYVKNEINKINELIEWHYKEIERLGKKRNGIIKEYNSIFPGLTGDINTC